MSSTLPALPAADSETLLEQQGDRRGGCDVPVDSPEPVTMIALAGGAAAVGAMSRRRKKSEQPLED